MGRLTQPFSMWRITDFRHKSAIRHTQLNEMAVCVYCEHAKFLLDRIVEWIDPVALMNQIFGSSAD
jgi:hypothetical protein